MVHSLEERVSAFEILGKKLKKIALSIEKTDPSPLDTRAELELFRSAMEAGKQNAWFTKNNVSRAIGSLSQMPGENNLKNWAGQYPELSESTGAKAKTIAVIMAGNIPLVGFHDFLCVLIAGHRFLGKLSSQDSKLPEALGNLLVEINPGFKESISFSEGPLEKFDAVIATGSNNSARYFEYYFGKYPHIIRKNRSSLAILSGNENPDHLKALGEDVFSYFGLGCRNVSKLMVPADYRFDQLKEAWKEWESLAQHSKYFNNYEYHKAILLVNKEPHIDTGFCLLKEDTGLSSPVSLVFYEKYHDRTHLEEYLRSWKEDLQCIAADPDIKVQAAETIPFGKSQQPELWDYADGVDTLKFLLSL